MILETRHRQREYEVQYCRLCHSMPSASCATNTNTCVDVKGTYRWKSFSHSLRQGDNVWGLHLSTHGQSNLRPQTTNIRVYELECCAKMLNKNVFTVVFWINSFCYDCIFVNLKRYCPIIINLYLGKYISGIT